MLYIHIYTICLIFLFNIYLPIYLFVYLHHVRNSRIPIKRDKTFANEVIWEDRIKDQNGY